MFLTGDIVFDPLQLTIYIVENGRLRYIKHTNNPVVADGTLPSHPIASSDRLASQLDLDTVFQDGAIFPKWAITIQESMRGINPGWFPMRPTIQTSLPISPALPFDYGKTCLPKAMGLPMHQEPVIEFKPLSALKTFREHCNHTFVEYVGFTQCFEYCIHCDIKK